ncbi:MAG: biotin/lipoyl-containing protein [Motiliproteus sp.]
MSEVVKVRLVDLPECWESCGNCSAEEFEVVEVLVAVGDRVHRYDPLLSWEADKSAFELPAPYAGTVVEVLVAEGDVFDLSKVLLLLQVAG